MLADWPQTFSPSEYLVRPATEAWERRGAARLRRAVFCDEQGLFPGDDRDAVDGDPTALTIVAVSCAAGQPDEVVGTVRIHRPGPRLWHGSRLAVDRAWRHQTGLATALIRLAVGTARTHGCNRFLADVQSRNAPMFVQLHWHTLDERLLHGHPHHLMTADLAHYPPVPGGEVRLITMPRQAA